MMVYDVTMEESFNNIRNHYNNIKEVGMKIAQCTCANQEQRFEICKAWYMKVISGRYYQNVIFLWANYNIFMGKHYGRNCMFSFLAYVSHGQNTLFFGKHIYFHRHYDQKDMLPFSVVFIHGQNTFCFGNDIILSWSNQCLHS